MQNLPDIPKRFTNYTIVLGKQGFTSWRFYYEVQVSGKTEWDLAVVRESVNRKGKIKTFTPQDGVWTMSLRNKNKYTARDDPSVSLSLREKPQKVGVFVDYEEGLVSFYDVEARSHIYSFTVTGESSSLLTEEQLQCSICLEVFTDPITTPCGHSFCKSCITQSWDTSPQCNCPYCKEKFTMRPELKINIKLKEVADHFKNRSKETPESLEVLCDVCTGVKQKAVKSCLDCGVTFCMSHLEPHINVPKYKKHKLIKAVKNLDKYTCQKHERPLELFCRDDQMYLCQFCTEGEHKDHKVIPLEEESGQRQSNVIHVLLTESSGKTQSELQQMIQKRIKKIQEIKHSVEFSKRNTEKEKSDSVEVFTSLMRSIGRCQAELLKVMEEKQKAAEKQAEGLIKDLEQEIEELKKRDAELEQLSHTDDHLHLLQVYPSLRIAPHTKNWTEISINTELSVDALRTALSQLQKTLNEKLKETVSKELKKIQQYAVDVTLDPDTVNPFLMLSDEGKQVMFRQKEQNLPENPKRFRYYTMVLGKQGFFSGRFYYEVQVSGKTDWRLGVVRKARDDPYVSIFLREKPQKLGVFVDYEDGLVSFYDVGARFHIYSFTVADESSSLLTEEQLRCPVCVEVFTDPVTTPCGHNFCKSCITQSWDTSPHHNCPYCKGKFIMRPELKINIKLKEVADHFKNRSKETPESLEVLCDVCTGVKQKAVKSCLDCGVTFCTSHLEPHINVPKYKKHKLINAVKNLEKYTCQKHERPLELFCRDDQMYLCQFCTEGEHKDHKVIPLEEESGQRKSQLVKTQSELQQMIQKRLKKIQEINHSVELSKRNTEKEKSDSVEVFTSLIRSIESSQAELLEVMEEKQKAAEKQAEGLIKDLEQEIEELKKRDAELEQLSHTDDHLHLLQVYPSLRIAPHTKNWTEISINTELSVDTLRTALSQLQETLNEKLKETASKELKKIQRYAVDVTLDPDTVNPFLMLSDEGKQVMFRQKEQNLPENPKRFRYYAMVLGKQGFFSGRFYYEVQVSGKTDWRLGVVRESVNRKSKIETFNPQDGLWTVALRNGNECQARDDPYVSIFLREKPQKVGVFVDYEDGLVSFYDVGARFHIYSFTGQSFTEKLYPCFNPCSDDEEPHINVPKYKKHKLIKAVKNLEKYTCQKHERPLELFCRDDQMYLCQFCTEGDHKDHKVIPLEEESGQRKSHLGKTQSELQQMIQKRLKKIQEINHSVELSKAGLLEVMEEKQKAAEKQAEGLIKDLEQEIEKLKKRDADLEQLSHTDDHLYFLQVSVPFSITQPQFTRYCASNWTEISINTELSVDALRTALPQLQKTLNEKLRETVDVVLDPDTASPFLILSDDGKQVTCGNAKQNLPDTPKRFTNYLIVLGKQRFSSGRFYFEVQVSGKTEWRLGVARESVYRKSKIETFKPQDGVWTLALRNGNEYKARDDPYISLFLRENPEKVGVFVDYEEGLVSFYDVEARSHIYSFT
ncbi:hypothetical protein QTP70_024795, partial [Hemibagrus guttatus]